jgi:hypothetical protein
MDWFHTWDVPAAVVGNVAPTPRQVPDGTSPPNEEGYTSLPCVDSGVWDKTAVVLENSPTRDDHRLQGHTVD